MPNPTANFGWLKPDIGASNDTWGQNLNDSLDGIDKLLGGYFSKAAPGHLTLSKTAADGTQVVTVFGQTAGVNRWEVVLNGPAQETGADVGANFAIGRFHDNGGYIDSPLFINRQTGIVTVTQQPVNANDITTKTYVDTKAASAAVGVTPIGGVIEFAGLNVPAGWLACNGVIYNISAYPALAGVIGSRYGGNGTTTFAVPNLNGRVTLGTTGSGGAYPLGAAAGETTHLLTTTELPAHSHGITQTPHSHGVTENPHNHSVNDVINTGGTGLTPGGLAFGVGSTTTTPSTTGLSINAANADIAFVDVGGDKPTGGGGHNNMQPYTALWKIIRAA
jgi:microcystin-dependent protein